MSNCDKAYVVTDMLMYCEDMGTSDFQSTALWHSASTQQLVQWKTRPKHSSSEAEIAHKTWTHYESEYSDTSEFNVEHYLGEEAWFEFAGFQNKKCFKARRFR